MTQYEPLQNGIGHCKLGTFVGHVSIILLDT